MAAKSGSEMTSSSSTGTAWPRNFRVIPSISVCPKFWSHELYRGPNNQPVKILYSRTKLQSEEIALEFLEESVVGFDMEWPWHNKDQSDIPLQQRVGLIQIASEDKIALFHIGLHAGQTAKDVLAPALRKIIESESILKAGVGILNADFSRLHRWFGLTPRGAFELSHLHNLVTYGARHPNKVTTKMKALASLVEEHLGHPLHKGKVRTSNWSRPLNQAQIIYAAADAYAGVMLYHCMNARRLEMDPAPPLPLHAEKYLPMRQGMGSIMPVLLGSTSKDKSGISAVEFYQEAMGEQKRTSRQEVATSLEHRQKEDAAFKDEEEQEQEVLTAIDAMPPGDQAAPPPPKGAISTLDRQAESRTEEDMRLVVIGRRGRHVLLAKREISELSKVPETHRLEHTRQIHSRETMSDPSKDTENGQVSRQTISDPDTTKALFARLSAHRKRVAKEQQCAAFVVAHNTLLSAISERRPRNEQELRRIRGIGKIKAELYGAAWLAIIHEFLEERAAAALIDEQEMASAARLSKTPASPRTQAGQIGNMATGSHNKTPVVLHTGLSFEMDSATLNSKSDQELTEIDDDSSAFGTPLRSPSPSNLKRKRELLDPSIRTQTKQRPTLPMSPLHSRRPAAKTTKRPDLVEAAMSMLVPTRPANETAPIQVNIQEPSLARPQHTSPKQISLTTGASCLDRYSSLNEGSNIPQQVTRL